RVTPWRFATNTSHCNEFILLTPSFRTAFSRKSRTHLLRPSICVCSLSHLLGFCQALTKRDCSLNAVAKTPLFILDLASPCNDPVPDGIRIATLFDRWRKHAIPANHRYQFPQCSLDRHRLDRSGAKDQALRPAS